MQNVLNTAARSARTQVATLRLRALAAKNDSVQRAAYVHMQALRRVQTVEAISNALAFIAAHNGAL